MNDANTITAPPYRLGNEKLIKATERAGAKIRDLLGKQARPEGALRISIVGGGCSGLSYKLDIVDAFKPNDILVESGGGRVVTDGKSALYLTGSELDWSDALVAGGFKIKNPNATSSCSCGESFGV
ncbi:MAG: iron-sulfur cluster assembly accessory protein [Verrucomicrobia bacterium]|nr:iron-sulfur cluster assembly accessory protein [Verrucomicrobiota bacterium]